MLITLDADPLGPGPLADPQRARLRRPPARPARYDLDPAVLCGRGRPDAVGCERRPQADPADRRGRGCRGRACALARRRSAGPRPSRGRRTADRRHGAGPQGPDRPRARAGRRRAAGRHPCPGALDQWQDRCASRRDRSGDAGRRRPASPTWREILQPVRWRLLAIAGCNPAYDAPPSLGLKDLIPKAGLSIHLGMHFDETAALATWHVPESHPLESWSDLRSVDGTASIVQPLIRPLYGTRTLHGLLAGLQGAFDADDYALVRATWRSRFPEAAFDAKWRQILQDGTHRGYRERGDATEPAGSAERGAARSKARLCADPAGRSLHLGWRLRQQCLAAGMPEAADQGGVGQRTGDQCRGRRDPGGLGRGCFAGRVPRAVR